MVYSVFILNRVLKYSNIFEFQSTLKQKRSYVSPRAFNNNKKVEWDEITTNKRKKKSRLIHGSHFLS